MNACVDCICPLANPPPREDPVKAKLQEQQVAPAGDDDMSRKRAESEDDEIEQGTFETLSALARNLWESAAAYLSGEEKKEWDESHEREIQRMNTLELRSHVKAGKELQKAQEELIEAEEVTGKDIARAQRQSMHITSGHSVFDGDLFAKLVKSSLDESTGEVNASRFLAASNSVPLLMGGLGRTFEFASSDLLKKLDVADKRMKETAAHLKVHVDEVTLQQMVELDVANGTTHAGKKAAPASRTILRLLWFFDFIAALLDNLASSPDKSLKQICSKTYEETLAPRHIWVLRRAARSGMGLLPPKAVFRKRLGTENLSEKEECERVASWAAEVSKVAGVMWKYMKSMGLEELP